MSFGVEDVLKIRWREGSAGVNVNRWNGANHAQPRIHCAPAGVIVPIVGLSKPHRAEKSKHFWVGDGLF